MIMLLEAIQDRVVVFYLIQGGFETSGHSVHQRGSKIRVHTGLLSATWHGVTFGYINRSGLTQLNSHYRTVRVSRTMSNQATNWFYKIRSAPRRAAPIKFYMVRRGTARPIKQALN